MSEGAGAMPAQALEEVVRRTVARHLLFARGSITVVGFSGGPDSLALLHLLHRLAPEWGLTLRAAHLNHRLRGADSDADAVFAAATCRAWGVPLVQEAVDVQAEAERRGLAVEEAARQVRYAFLGRVAAAVGAATVAVGHNADDQVETVLMHFLRGAGLGGLRGMLPSSDLSGLRTDEALPTGVRLVRPLLHASRSLIEAYCAERDLHPRFDRSNLDTTYFRNRLRLELIPYLESFNPNLKAVVGRTADVLAADHDLLQRERDQAWQAVVCRSDAESVEFELEGFRALHLSLQRGLIRRAIAQLRPPLRNIDMIHVEQAVEAVQRASGAGAKAGLPQGLLLTVGYDTFVVRDAASAIVAGDNYPQLPAGAESVPLPAPGEARLAAGWVVKATVVPVQMLAADALERPHPWTAYLDRSACPGGLLLRPRREGERMQPLGLGGRSKKLNELMINLKVPAAYRARYPVLARGDTVLWLPGYHVDHRARVREDTREVVRVEVERA